MLIVSIFTLATNWVVWYSMVIVADHIMVCTIVD